MYEEKKKYLKQLRVIYKLICSYEEELLEHRIITQCAPIGCYEQIVKVQGDNRGRLEASVIKILEYEDKIKETIAKYIDIKSKTLDAIEKLTDDKEKLVLRLRYIKGITHEETAKIIGYSVIQTKRICESALEKFIIPES